MGNPRINTVAEATTGFTLVASFFAWLERHQGEAAAATTFIGCLLAMIALLVRLYQLFRWLRDRPAKTPAA
jgi:lipopolysaccharide export LptBFGC system permease protein LptF